MCNKCILTNKSNDCKVQDAFDGNCKVPPKCLKCFCLQCATIVTLLHVHCVYMCVLLQIALHL